MAQMLKIGPKERLRYSVSLVRQGERSFFTLTMPSDVLARTCVVSTRAEDPKMGFQRTLDEKRAEDIADYIDNGGTIPNSIVLSAQPVANLKVLGRGKTLEFEDTPGGFLILDGQHRVYGFAKVTKPLRVPVVIYNGLSRTEESRLFIDINTKQRPVPAQLLLDIKGLADIEDESEGLLRDIFDQFHEATFSSMSGLTAPFDSAKNKISRVTFNSAVKPLLEFFGDRSAGEIFDILNSYMSAVSSCLTNKSSNNLLSKPVIFRAVVGLFPVIAQRVQDKFSSKYTSSNFFAILEPIFSNIPTKKLLEPGTSWVALRDYFEGRLKKKMSI
jgi:DGQHR domain-containing protein